MEAQRDPIKFTPIVDVKRGHRGGNMAQDHRIATSDGKRLPYSCENRRYITNIEKGFPHQPSSSTRGSVLEASLMESEGYSLWLEHAMEKETRQEVYWLMWYSPEGKPTIPFSGVFSKEDLENMLGKLARFVP